MAHPERLLLLTLMLSLLANQWSPVVAFEDFLDDIFSIFFDSESESESSEPIHVSGKHAVINVTCDNCTLTINCPTCNSMSMADGNMTITSPAPPAPPAPPTSNAETTTAAPNLGTTMKATENGDGANGNKPTVPPVITTTPPSLL